MHHCWWCSLLHQETALLDRQPALPMLLRVLVHDTFDSMTYIQMQNCLSCCSFCISSQQQGTSIDHICLAVWLFCGSARRLSLTFRPPALASDTCAVCWSCSLICVSTVHFDGRLSLLYPDSNRRPLVEVSVSPMSHLCP